MSFLRNGPSDKVIFLQSSALQKAEQEKTKHVAPQ